MPDKKCLICQCGLAKNVLIFKSPDKYEVAIGIEKKGYLRKWARCVKCGFHYAIKSRNKIDLRDIYVSEYRAASAPWRTESPEELFKKVSALPYKKSETKIRVKWIKERIADAWEDGIVERTALPYRFLDIGGGTGIFAYAFKNHHWRPHIVDPDTNNDFIKTKLRIPLVRDFYKSGLFPAKFNLISMIYVLEHVHDPVRFLKDAKKDMSANAFLYIEVPDAISFSKKTRSDDIFNSTHLWMFDPKTLPLLLDRAGFEIIDMNRTKTVRGHFALKTLIKHK